MDGVEVVQIFLCSKNNGRLSLVYKRTRLMKGTLESH